MPRSAKFSLPCASLRRHLVFLQLSISFSFSRRRISFSSPFAFIGRLFLPVCTDAPIPFSRSRKFLPCRRDEKLIGNSGGTVGSVSRIPRRIYVVCQPSIRRARAYMCICTPTRSRTRTNTFSLSLSSRFLLRIYSFRTHVRLRFVLD